MAGVERQPEDQTVTAWAAPPAPRRATWPFGGSPMHARKPTAVFAALIPWMLAGCAGGAAVGTGTQAPPSPLVTPGPVASATPEPISAAQVVAVAQQFWPTSTDG